MSLFAALPDALAGHGPALLPVSAETADAERAFVEQAGGLEGMEVAVDSDVAVVIRTSGSTGRPKRVGLSARALVSSAQGTNEILGAGHWLLALPAHYIAGLQVLVRSLAAGTTPVVAHHLRSDAVDRHFAPAAFVAATNELAAQAIDGAQAGAPTASPARLLTALVPAQLHVLLEDAVAHPETLAALRRYAHIMIGGQRPAPGLLQAARDAGVDVVTTYGSSETAGGCVYTLADGSQRRVGDTTLAVRDGSVYVSGSVLASGYVADPERTAQTFVEHGGSRWLTTGDLGDLTKGVLTVTGRDDQTIITGGVKLDLNEVHDVLHSLPGLVEAVAVPFDDEKWGTRFAVYADGRNRVKRMTREELNSVLRERLGRHAGAAAITYFPFGLPRLSSGKVDLHSLHDTAEALAGSALAAQRPAPKDSI
nr:AMP-binding protein [Pseudoclavibacter sp. 13-3]